MPNGSYRDDTYWQQATKENCEEKLETTKHHYQDSKWTTFERTQLFFSFCLTKHLLNHHNTSNKNTQNISSNTNSKNCLRRLIMGKTKKNESLIENRQCFESGRTKSVTTFEVPSFNVINGGSHAGNRLACQEFMILPTGLCGFCGFWVCVLFCLFIFCCFVFWCYFLFSFLFVLWLFVFVFGREQALRFAC